MLFKILWDHKQRKQHDKLLPCIVYFANKWIYKKLSNLRANTVAHVYSLLSWGIIVKEGKKYAVQYRMGIGKDKVGEITTSSQMGLD